MMTDGVASQKTGTGQPSSSPVFASLSGARTGLGGPDEEASAWSAREREEQNVVAVARAGGPAETYGWAAREAVAGSQPAEGQSRQAQGSGGFAR